MKKIAVLILALIAKNAFSQIDANALFSLPSYTSNQIQSIDNPNTGSLFYNKDDHKIYQYNGSNWIALISTEDEGDNGNDGDNGDDSNDHDFYKQGSTDAASSIEDAIYHKGDIAIGTTVSNATLDIFTNDSDKISSLHILKETQNNTIDNSVIKNELSGNGNARIYGVHTTISNTGNGEHYGSNNYLTGNGNGTQYGSAQLLYNTGSGVHHGNYNYLTGNGNGEKNGTYNQLNGNGNGEHTGTQNIVSGAGSGTHYGVRNRINGSSTGKQYGTYQEIYNTADNEHTATYNYLSGNGNGKKYGTQNIIASASSAVKYGSYNKIYDNGGGKNYAGYFDAPGINNYAAVFNQGNVTVNEAKGNYNFLVKTSNDTAAFFVEGQSDNIGVGTTSPKAKVEISSTDGTAPLRITPTTTPTNTTMAGQLFISSENGILYAYDGSRSKWLSVARNTMRWGSNKKNNTDTYLKQTDGTYANYSGYRILRNATITAIATQTEIAQNWVLEIRKNDNTTIITSLTINSTKGAHNTNLNIDLNQGDYLQAYCNGSKVAYPEAMIEIAWRK